MSLNNKIEKSDLARDALYDKVNVIAEELDEKKQELLIAGENIKTINGESIVGSGNVEISGLNRNISNCITEIPQDIKLELNDGTVTLKAGSKVWIPYGTSDVYNIGDTDSFGNTVVDKSFSDGKFFYAIKTSVDAITSANDIYTYTVVYNPKTKVIDYWGRDGTTSSDGYSDFDGMHYNTSENNIRIVYNDGEIYGNSFSLPICVVSKNTTSATGFTFIDQVFNGFGYIGSMIFALPGVKGLMPNGKNEDGSLKNDVFEITSIQLVSRTSDNKYYMILGDPQGAYNPNSLSTNYMVRENYATDIYGYKYDEYRNMFVGIGSNNIGTQIYMVIVGSFEVYRGLIRFFNSKQVFKAVDSNYNISITYWD